MQTNSVIPRSEQKGMQTHRK